MTSPLVLSADIETAGTIYALPETTLPDALPILDDFNAEIISAENLARARWQVSIKRYRKGARRLTTLEEGILEEEIPLAETAIYIPHQRFMITREPIFAQHARKNHLGYRQEHELSYYGCPHEDTLKAEQELAKPAEERSLCIVKELKDFSLYPSNRVSNSPQMLRACYGIEGRLPAIKEHELPRFFYRSTLDTYDQMCDNYGEGIYFQFVNKKYVDQQKNAFIRLIVAGGIRTTGLNNFECNRGYWSSCSKNNEERNEWAFKKWFILGTTRQKEGGAT